ncbi:hypothetical protein EYF80_042593 [Liparis tanakae]|uniref:Uncharacterized protein n=1 Tax=Liparis tanakae TaxID=230148 RepID=A0A4Z2G3T3_9TELE|nr:hypothetical protein EYF80_042593 [Liparis tanakae]
MPMEHMNLRLRGDGKQDETVKQLQTVTCECSLDTEEEELGGYNMRCYHQRDNKYKKERRTTPESTQRALVDSSEGPEGLDMA